MSSAVVIPDHTLRRPIGRGAYGEVWLARNVMGTPRAVKIVWRRQFESDRPYEREFAGIQRYEPVSRSADGLVHVRTFEFLLPEAFTVSVYCRSDEDSKEVLGAAATIAKLARKLFP